MSNFTPLTITVTSSFLLQKGLWINPRVSKHLTPSTGEFYKNTAWDAFVNGTLPALKANSKPTPATIPGQEPTPPIVSMQQYGRVMKIGEYTSTALVGLTSSNSKFSNWNDAYDTMTTPPENDPHIVGFGNMIHNQAVHEFDLYRNRKYEDFLHTFSTVTAFIDERNEVINAMVRANTFLEGSYSNMNDLTTSDVTGVNQSLLFFGQDLIALGKALDLSKISTFGEPYTLLSTLVKNNAVTDAVFTALMLQGFTTTEIDAMVSDGFQPTIQQQVKMYEAFTMIAGADLLDVMIPLNCSLTLNTLADLLDVYKLFENSRDSLTVPVYNTDSTIAASSKVYHLIFVNGGVNSTIDAFGDSLISMIPHHMAIAAGAFRASMMQIKNINKMQIEQFAQIVSTLETMQGLTLVGATGIPANAAIINEAKPILATGSGANGTLTMCDFYGCMSGLPFNFELVYELLKRLTTPTLIANINNLTTALSTPPDPLTGELPAGAMTIDAAITAVDNELIRIKSQYPTLVAELNGYWDAWANQLKQEQDSRNLIPLNADYTQGTLQSITGFGRMIDTYAHETSYHGVAQVLEAISDIRGTDSTTNDVAAVGGQTLIGAMRESRNRQRLGLAGGELDSDIELSPALLETYQSPMQNVAANAKSRMPYNGSSAAPVYPIPTINSIIPGGIVTGEPIVPGSLAGSPDRDLVPPNLSITKVLDTLLPSVQTPHDAVEAVTTCNCDCWELVKPK